MTATAELVERLQRHPYETESLCAAVAVLIESQAARIAELEAALARALRVSEEQIVVMRPYPHIVCNAMHPNHCKREADGYCYLCHIPGFHTDRAPAEPSEKP